MTVPSDLRRCTGHFICDAANYDSGNDRLIDQSGLDHHLPLAFGSPPAFTARSGVDCIDLTNTFYFEMRNPIPVEGSVVFKMNPNAAPAAGLLHILHWRQSTYDVGDHVALTPKEPWESYDTRAIYFAPNITNIVRALNYKSSDPIATSPTLALNAWYVVTVVFNHATLQSKIQIGAGAIATDSMSPEPTIPAQNCEDVLRFGYLRAGFELTAPSHLSIAEMAFFQDDILLNQPELAASLVASWS